MRERSEERRVKEEGVGMKEEGGGRRGQTKEERSRGKLITYASPPPRRPAVRTFPWFKISQKESVATGAVCAAVGFTVSCAVGFAVVGVLEGLRVGLRVGAARFALTVSPT